MLATNYMGTKLSKLDYVKYTYFNFDDELKNLESKKNL